MLPYDLSKLGRIAALMMVIYCAAELIFIWGSFQLVGFYSLLESGLLSDAEITQRADRLDSAGLMQGGFFLVALLAAYITASIWMYRAAANAQAVMPNDNRITPGWTVGWFFVPFANLVMPYRALRQHWNWLHGTAEMDAPPPRWMLVWWLLWIAGNVASTVGTRINLNASTIAEFRFASGFDIAASIFAIGAALLFRHLILEMTRASAAATPPQTPSLSGETS